MFKQGQKVKHKKIPNEVFTVVRDEGGSRVLVKDKNGIEISPLRENLIPLEGENEQKGKDY